jgi:glutamate-ammonia-ligase adenylyltransferase
MYAALHGMTTSEFPFEAFAEPERSLRSVDKLHELFISSGAIHPIEEFSRALTSALEKLPDPDRGVTNLLRFVEATLSRSSLFNDLLSYPVLMDVLMRMLSGSQYFADILVRDPELFRWLTASDALVQPRTKEVLRAEVERAMRVFQKPEKKLDSLRRLYRREILRIGARDLLGEADLATVTRELSHLADVLVEASCIIAQQQLRERFPESPHTPYSVIGLGKLGGLELNYSSDIDVLVVYGNEGEVKDARGITRTHHEYFNAFVEKMVQNLSQSSAEGHLYRVDLRLRPEGKASPLARSLQSYLLYYESRGELWERQMLIKARPIAGDPALGEEFLRQLEPFVYPRTVFQNPKEYIARIKARIEAAIVGEENVKLRAGGIRDIEFIVQALQLVNGGKNRSIRSANTLEAIQQLAEASLLTDSEQRKLTEAYIFFRTLEHRLQTMLNTQTHVLPEDAVERRILARKVGLASAEELERRNKTLLKQVREIFEAILSVGTGLPDAGLAAVIDGGVGIEATERMMAAYGFADARRAAKNFSSMVFGSSMAGVKELDSRARSAFREIADELLRQVARTPGPDMTLQNLALVATSQPFPEQLYTQLKEENFRRMLLQICATSPRFSKGLARHPLLLETLATDPGALIMRLPDGLLPLDNIVEQKNQEEIRIGIRYVLGITSFDEMTAELTQLADAVMTAVLGAAVREIVGRSAPFAVFALGKYGTGEIIFDADLDVLFISETKSVAVRNKLEQVATRVVQQLSAMSERGKLYDVDARLRPEGRNAPLVVDRRAYLAYLKSRASLWERQSLTRLRFVAGDKKLGAAVVKDVHAFVFESSLPGNWVQDIVAMRKRMEKRSRVSGSELIDLKLSPGGMVDVEFLAQMLQLRYGGSRADLRHARTCDVLRAFSSLLTVEQAEALMQTYQWYRKLETLLRITLEERGSILPAREKLELLAKLLQFPDSDGLHHHLRLSMNNVRQHFQTTTEHLV